MKSLHKGLKISDAARRSRQNEAHSEQRRKSMTSEDNRFARTDSQDAERPLPPRPDHLKNILQDELDLVEKTLVAQHRRLVGVVDRFCRDVFPLQTFQPHESSGRENRSSLASYMSDMNDDITLPEPHEEFTLPGTIPPEAPASPTPPPKRRSFDRAQWTQKANNTHAETAGEEKKGQGQGKGVFVDADAMKAKVKEAVMKPPYTAANYYHEEGWAQAIARSRWFDYLTLFVIGLNSLWIAVETDLNPAPTLFEALPLFQIGENFFCIYFFLEIVVRYCAFAEKRTCLRDKWFIFDSSLVFMMVCETWIINYTIYFLEIDGSSIGNVGSLRFVRMLRLTRMARMIRLLRAMPELMVLIKGIAIATRTVFFTLCLLLVFVYLFGIALAQMTEPWPDLKKRYFNSVPESMSTLMLNGVLPDNAPLVEETGASSYLLAVVIMIFVLLTSLTVLNMLVGVLCEVVSVVSAVEKEQRSVQYVRDKLLGLMQRTDQDYNERISRSEFEELLFTPEAARVIQDVGVDVVGLVDFLDHLFHDGADISFTDFMELLLQLRSSNVATVKDIVDMRKYLMHVAQEANEGLMVRIRDDMNVALNQSVHKAVMSVLSSASLDCTEEVL
eukprot:TRINITY_DN19914_c0_g8_i1.p1 TRINITY_DN19914_c0_g8~~TRINITY_DN19914_c0_g8_i1.p1  ORF type:complete len:615 (+),score=99.91 TRINITY_DN19914_c0_g8_i1:48-1892(+)